MTVSVSVQHNPDFMSDLVYLNVDIGLACSIHSGMSKEQKVEVLLKSVLDNVAAETANKLFHVIK